jgi:MscS family membrane protein
MRKNKAIVAAWCLFLFSGAARAQTGPAASDTLGRNTPRETLVNFLRTAHQKNFQQASQYLQGAATRTLARQLQTVLDSALSVNVNQVSDSPQGDLNDGLPPDRERIGVVSINGDSADITLTRVAQRGASVWLFSTDTLQQIPALYAHLTPSWVEQLVPDALANQEIFGIRLWRILALLILAALAIGVGWLASLVILRVAGSIARRTTTSFDDQIVEMLRGPLRLLIAVFVFHLGILLLGLPLLLRQSLAQFEVFVGVLAVCWFALRLVDFASTEANTVLLRTQRASATSMIPLGRRVVKVLVFFGALLIILDNVGFDLRAVLAGLGVGGIAIALAAQKTIENIFGGIALVVDQPVRVGDFCKFGDNVGTVQDIGLRSTRIRTLDRTVISVPNAQFSVMSLENFAPREKVWFHPTIGLRMDTTADQLRYVLAEIRKLLYEHSKVEPGGRIRLTGFGTNSLNLEIFAYVLTSDYGEFVAIQEDLLLRIMEIVDEAGTSLALPAQNTFIARDHGMHPERTAAVTGEVRKWKEERRLPFPDYAPDEVAAMRARVPYPSEHSVLGKRADERT